MGDPDPNDLLSRIDLIMRELAALRDEVAASLPAPVGAKGDAVDDFSSESLLEISTAVERFNRPADSLRWMCRKQGCGVKIAGRWMASGPRLARYLNGK
jgi:hypothetical protein